jgi:hypothetical protein
MSRAIGSSLKYLFVILLLATLLLMTATTARGECWYEPLCDAYGNCHDVQICDSMVDDDQITPPERIYPDDGPIAPIPSFPPLGTTRCHQIRRCNSHGNCFWDQVCY